LVAFHLFIRQRQRLSGIFIPARFVARTSANSTLSSITIHRWLSGGGWQKTQLRGRPLPTAAVENGGAYSKLMFQNFHTITIPDRWLQAIRSSSCTGTGPVESGVHSIRQGPLCRQRRSTECSERHRTFQAGTAGGGSRRHALQVVTGDQPPLATLERQLC
jgi:hypothetical protein